MFHHEGHKRTGKPGWNFVFFVVMFCSLVFFSVTSVADPEQPNENYSFAAFFAVGGNMPFRRKYRAAWL